MPDKVKILKKFGRQVRIFRKQKMMSREDFALKCRLSVKEIEDLEAGKFDPGLSTILIFAQILNINPEDLIQNTGRHDNEYYAYRFYILNILRGLSKKDLKKVIALLSSI